MNELQEKIFNVIAAIRFSKGFNDFIKFSEVRYGFLNYISKYSLANEYYSATEGAFQHLSSIGLLTDKGVRRGAKNRKNGFMYEHPIPVRIIADEVIRSDDPEEILNILEKTNHITIMRLHEDQLLGGTLRANMPDGWDFKAGNVYARYERVGIKYEKFKKVKMYGSVLR